MDLPTIVSFYTIGTPYETEALRLKQSCERLQTPFIIEGLESTGDWIRNCSLKAAFVLRHLQQLKRPLLWVDADAEILLPLDYFRGAEFDVACYVQWSISGLPPTMDRREMPVMSGTVYLNYTPGGVRIAEIWAAYCANTPEVWDQDVLACALWDYRSIVRFKLLPQGYCKISDHKWREPVRVPYILHHQASRRYKEKVTDTTSPTSKVSRIELQIVRIGPLFRIERFHWPEACSLLCNSIASTLDHNVGRIDAQVFLPTGVVHGAIG